MNTRNICFYRLYQYTKASRDFSASTKSIGKGVSGSLSHFRHRRVSYHTVSYHTVIFYIDEFPKRKAMGNCSFNHKKVKDHEVQNIVQALLVCFHTQSTMCIQLNLGLQNRYARSLKSEHPQLLLRTPHLPNVTLKCNSELVASA